MRSLCHRWYSKLSVNFARNIFEAQKVISTGTFPFDVRYIITITFFLRIHRFNNELINHFFHFYNDCCFVYYSRDNNIGHLHSVFFVAIIIPTWNDFYSKHQTKIENYWFFIFIDFFISYELELDFHKLRNEY